MNDEPELRRDPITGRWVLIAPERAHRPIALSGAGPRHRTSGERTPCPFCAGEEHDTPGEVYAIRDPGTAPNGPGWRLRVVPNKFPAVRTGAEPTPPAPLPSPRAAEIADASEARHAGQTGKGRNSGVASCAPFDVGGLSGVFSPLPFSLRAAEIAKASEARHAGATEGGSGGVGLFASAPAVGFAEVLIDCPEHVDNPTQLSDEQFRDVLRAYRERMIALAGDPRLAHVAVFKNVGAEAGASLGHTHSQLIATPVVPALIRSELSGAEAYAARTGRCAFCDVVEEDLADGSRVVARSANFVAVTAFAPRFAYETWVLPVRHESRYEAITDDAARELAVLLKRVLRALDVAKHSPAYNWFLHTSPLHAGELPHYHWHLEIMPRTSRPAGLEWGFGCHIATTAPERAAAELRAALEPASGRSE